MRENHKDVVKHLHDTHKILVKEIKRTRFLIHFKYPKLFLLVIFILAAYFLFKNLAINNFVGRLEDLGYIGFFIAGMFFSFGFSTPFAVGFFIVSQPSNIILASIVGGLGSVVGDFIIFKSIRKSFLDELEKFEREKPIAAIHKAVKNNFHIKMSAHLLYVFAGIIIASPLPDEIGVAMLATVKHIKARTLNILSFLLNSVGIFVILMLSR